MADTEKIFTIPLRRAYNQSRAQRTACAARLVRSFLEQHMKSDTIKIGSHLNTALWVRGAQKPPRRVRVRAIRDGDVVKAELVGFDYAEFKAAPKKERKGMRERMLERLGPKALQKEKEAKLAEGTLDKEEKADERETPAESSAPEKKKDTPAKAPAA